MPVNELAQQMLDKRHKQLRKRGRHLMQLSTSQRHAVRIATKKLRYTAEFLSGLYAQNQSRAYLDTLAGLQDVLGALNDVATTQRLLMSLHTPRTNAANSEALEVALGWTSCRGSKLLTSLRQSWEVFLQQKPFWRK
jgi:CHAD domain-containing protein